ncbi:MAG: glycosyltransferase family 4 protein [Lachnospiraceae bacterium]|nr:glycosyltransferase family 4 protein [Lachnospiraceae bacterium]
MFFLRAPQHGGTENVVVQLCEALKPHVRKIVICGANGFDRSKISESDIKYVEIPDITIKRIGTSMVVLRTLRKIIQEDEITIVHAHHRMALIYATLLQRTIPFLLFYTAHNSFQDKKMIYRYALKRSGVIACGEAVKNNIVTRYGIEKNSITVIHNAVRPYFGTEEPDALLIKLRESGHRLVGNFARLTKEKGVDVFIKAVSQIKGHNNVKYVIVGDGEEREQLESMAKKCDIFDRVLFLGFRKDVQNIMQQMDFIVISSFIEGLPLVPIEAFSVGKTVIGTNIDGTNEIVQHNYNGMLVEANDIKGMADTIELLLSDDKMLHDMEARAYETYCEGYSYERFKNDYLLFYERKIA